MSVPEPGSSSDFAAEPESVVRRAPFSDNPRVGARGQRTQQRILDGALRVFGEEGYEGASIDRITKRAGCSRVSFYQYFSSKEDVFRYLAGQVARQLAASTDALDPVTPERDGWLALRAWVSRHADIYERYQPMFRAFQAASESDQAVASGSARWVERIVSRVGSSVTDTDLPARQLDPMLMMIQMFLTRTLDVSAVMRAASSRSFTEERIQDAVTDVIHRSVFGLHPEVNVHPPARRRPPVIEFDPAMLDLLQEDDWRFGGDGTNRKALASLLTSGREVFATRGYHGTRVDDLAAAAGVSHGAFYRYFQNKEEMARVLTGRAVRTVGDAMLEIPDLAGDPDPATDAALRSWLRRYNAAQSGEAAMIRVWLDAALQDAALRLDSAAAFDWGWRRMARVLQPREFGDVDAEALVMVAMLSSFGGGSRSSSEIEATARIIERGLLGR
jgi:AcrR family transcriptional regulator